VGAVSTTTIHLEVDETVEWWRPLVHIFLCVPHLAYNAVLTGASLLAWLVSVPVVLVTGHLPRALGVLQVVVLRERARTFAFLFVLRRSTPPFATAWSASDPGDDPVQTLDVVLPASTSRVSAVTRPLVVIPHLLVLLPIGACLDFLYPVWMLAVAANRGWPAGMARTLASIERWVVELLLFVTMASDERPRFRLALDGAAVTA
jgi:hypothetical protein